MSTKQKKNGSNRIVELARNNSVPLMFILICAVCIPVSGFSPGYLLNEIMTRLGRNAFLILSLLIPDVYKRQAQEHCGLNGEYGCGRNLY